MCWDGDSKGAVNCHFASVTELHRTMGYIGNLSIEDVLKSVLMATLKASTNRSLRDAYHKVLDDLDDDKDLSFALIQDACARQFRRHPDERHPAAWSRDHPGTPRRNQGPHGATRTALNKTRLQPGDGVSAFLCNFLDDHGVKPAQVLKKAGLRHETPADWHSCDAIHALYMASQRFMPQPLQNDSEAASDDDASTSSPPSLILTLTLVRPEIFFFVSCRERTGIVFTFFLSLCVFLRLHTWRARHSQPLFATRTCIFL
jgi:hypothetical protein